jgi:hypothetical protein
MDWCSLSIREKFNEMHYMVDKPRHTRLLKCDAIICLIEHCILVNGPKMFEDSNMTINPLQINTHVESVLKNYTMLKRYPKYYNQILKLI